jgi:hypothetical protein
MSDDADRALEIEAELLAVSLSRISGIIPAGAPGECDDCGEIMPRLVDGRCGYCRDGRRPPLSRFDDAAPGARAVPDTRPDIVVQAATAPAIGAPVNEESDVMATAKPTANSRTISVPASGTVLAAIEKRAAEENLPWGRAAVSLLEDALAGPTLTQEAAVAIGDLAAATLDELLGEIGKRFADVVNADLVNAAVARAEAAEGQLATIQQVLANARPQA